ncbi:hypothetical protein [Variovorax sp. W2I14]|uniref:hypothetical protein n=1 Tax=Variovorax sp. W2I14 TaxID=3042290 RepID=UPI003D193B49
MLRVLLAAGVLKQQARLADGRAPAQHDLQSPAGERHAQIDGIGKARVLGVRLQHRPPPAVGLFRDELRPHAADFDSAGLGPQVHRGYVATQLVHVRQPVQQLANFVDAQYAPLLALMLSADDLALAFELPLHERRPLFRHVLVDAAGV